MCVCIQFFKMAVIVRRAVKSDMKAILGMIQELANFEKMPDGPALKVNDLERDGGFNGDNSLFVCFVAETNDESNPSIIGYALCFNTYSTWQGKTLFMEDLYVRSAHRTQGVGKLLLTKVISYAKETECNRCEFHVLHWNPARSFYEKMRAVDLTAAEGWHYYRLDKEAIDSFNEEA